MISRVVLAGLLLIATPGLARGGDVVEAAGDAEARFAAGAVAASEGDYATALAAFQAALAAGQAGPAVHYNIGVCAWALGDLETARESFLETAEYASMAALAHYNLGLVAQRQGEDEAARSWFRLARDNRTADPALIQLAVAALDALGPPPAPSRPLPRGTAVFLAANAGYDDNVALVADGELLGVSDLDSAYGELQLAALAPLGRDFSLQGGAFLLDYADLPELDQAGAQIELRYRPWIGAWRLELGAGYSLNQLDGERFEDQRSLSAGVTRRVGMDWRFRAQLVYHDIEAQEDFAGLSGDRLETRFQLRRYLQQQYWQLEYRFELNEREDQALSPDRHRLELEWRRQLGRQLELEAGVGWRHSSYDTADLSRTEQRATALLGLIGPITGRWQWVLRYDYARNDASVEEFDYSRNRGFAGIQANF